MKDDNKMNMNNEKWIMKYEYINMEWIMKMAIMKNEDMWKKANNNGRK